MKTTRMSDTIEAPLLDAQTPDNHDLQQRPARNPMDDSQTVTNSIIENDKHDSVAFIRYFIKSQGPVQVLIIILLFTIARGSTVGVVPTIVADRYARIRHGYDGAVPCSSFTRETQPPSCTAGAVDAQSAVSIASLLLNLSSFMTSSLIGSISDTRGRKRIILCSLFFSMLPPLLLILLQGIDGMDPAWYYAAAIFDALVDAIPVCLSSISDVLPPKWRAGSFGLVFGAAALGFAFGPLLATTMGHMAVSVLSLAFVILSFLFTLCFLPETLPEEVSRETLEQMRQANFAESSNEGRSKCAWIRSTVRLLLRPAKEMAILCRNRLFLLLTGIAFFGVMVFAGDQTLEVYYFENELDFDLRDVAITFVIFGVIGIFVLLVLMKPLIDCIGERSVLIVSFLFAIIYNIIYGFAQSKNAIFVGAVFWGFAVMAFPTISAVESNNVDESEQGHVQGALFSVASLANAIGPVSLQAIYRVTKDNPYPGPGTMFLVAASVQLIAVALACALPKDQTNLRKGRDNTIVSNAIRPPALTEELL